MYTHILLFPVNLLQKLYHILKIHLVLERPNFLKKESQMFNSINYEGMSNSRTLEIQAET